MTNPNAVRPATGGGAIDPFDEPGFDYEAYIAHVFDRVEADDPVLQLRNELRGWAEAAGFQHIDLLHLNDGDWWEMRFTRGTNEEVIDAGQAERWITFVSRGAQCRVAPGQFVAIVEGDHIAARFKLEPRPPPV